MHKNKTLMQENRNVVSRENSTAVLVLLGKSHKLNGKLTS